MEPPMHLIIMGVSGSGKTTIATALSERLGWVYAEADEFHSAENITRMSQGIPLTDEDRAPWLESIARWISDKSAKGESTIVTCSALKRRYRDVLAGADGDVRFVHLLGDLEIIRSRMTTRIGHFMPESLLPSQVSTLEPLQEDEQGLIVENVGTPVDVTDSIMAGLGLRA